MDEHRHFLVHKPYGYLSQFVNNQTKRKNKKLLGELSAFPAGTMSIGRLDQNSEGLLLLTTNGKVSAKVRSKEVEKEYFVQLDGEINTSAIEQLENGIQITANGELYQTMPCQVRKLQSAPVFPTARKTRDPRHGPTSWISITIREGKFRQVRKMTSAAGFPTLRLVRVRVGGVQLGNMKAGEVVEVTHFEGITSS